jgi:hypothetical protein
MSRCASGRVVTRSTYAADVVSDDDLSRREARGARWLPTSAVSTIEEAGRFVADLGLTLLFPAERIEAPSLWEAVAGEDAEPFASGMGAAESMVWEWKDELPHQGLAWYGKFLYRRGSLLSPSLLAALYPGRGEADDHRSFELSIQAYSVAEALQAGPLTTTALRQLVGGRSRYERGIGELQRSLLVTSAGVAKQRSGWPAGVVELTCRLFDVGGGPDRGYAVARFLETMLWTTPRDVSRAYGWPVATAREELDHLVAAGSAVHAGRGEYHSA